MEKLIELISELSSGERMCSHAARIYSFKCSVKKSIEGFQQGVHEMVCDAARLMLAVYRDIYGRLATDKLKLTPIPETLKKASEEEKAEREKEIIKAYYARYHELLGVFGLEGFAVTQNDLYPTMETVARLADELINRYYPEAERNDDHDVDNKVDEESDEDSDDLE